MPLTVYSKKRIVQLAVRQRRRTFKINPTRKEIAMRTLTADAQTPDMARRIQRKIFLGGITGLVTSIRKASQKAETAILQAADRKWFQDNPEDEPPAEFPSANDSHL